MDAAVGPELSRRQMFAAAGLVTLAASIPGLRRVTLPSGWIWPSPSGSTDGATTAGAGQELTLGRFSPHIGSDFAVRTGPLATVSVTLDDATARPPHPMDRPGLQGEAFSLLFQGRGSGAIPAGVHTVTHPALGSFPLFVAPVGRARGGQDYQAVVDRRVPAR